MKWTFIWTFLRCPSKHLFHLEKVKKSKEQLVLDQRTSGNTPFSSMHYKKEEKPHKKSYHSLV
jgi:hypothetical protein